MEASPPPVGGVGFEPDPNELALEAGGGSAGDAGLLAGVAAAAGALALGGAAVYARRRSDR